MFPEPGHDLIGFRRIHSLRRQSVAQIPFGFRKIQPDLQMTAEIAPEHRPHDDAGPIARKRHVRQPGIRKGHVGRLQQHVLQRIAVGDLLRRNPVLLPVEFEPPDESAARGLRTVQAPFGVVIPFRIPSLRRHFADGRTARRHQRPERIDIVGIRSDQPHPDHRHTFVRSHIHTGAELHRHSRLNRPRRFGTIIHHEVGVQSPDAECIHRGTPHTDFIHIRPGFRLPRQIKRDLFPGNVRIRRDH